MLTRFDDYPIHQTPEPVAQPFAGDRNFYDRYFFNGHDERGDLFFAISGLIALASFGLYRGKLHRSVLDDLPSLCAATFLAVSASVLPTLPTNTALDLPTLVRGLLLGIVCLTVGRAIAYQLIRFGRVRGRLRRCGLHATLCAARSRSR